MSRARPAAALAHFLRDRFAYPTQWHQRWFLACTRSLDARTEHPLSENKWNVRQWLAGIGSGGPGETKFEFLDWRARRMEENKKMGMAPVEVMLVIPANPKDIDNVRALTTPDVTYVSLNYSNPELKRVMPHRARARNNRKNFR